MKLAIRSGGQTGVDRAALDAAIAAGIPYIGWCPRGGWAEDYRSPPGLLAKYPALTETPSADPAQRTAWNVRDSDATLLLTRAAALESSPGSAFTRQCAELVFTRPFRIAYLDASDEPASTRRWLKSLARDDEDFVLNVAGPRESEARAIYASAFEFLKQLLRQLRASHSAANSS